MMFPQGITAVIIGTIIIVALCVLLHYEGLRLMSDYIPKPRRHHRKRVILLIFCLLTMHVVEIWLFGIGYYVLLSYADVGQLAGMATVNLFDCIYYSAMCYTTIGFGDIVPRGAIRLLTGMEGVVGLLMITWSASYTYVVMLETWKSR